jgi:antitoxin MazE
MEKNVRIVKWADTLAVRLPASLVDALDLKEGDQIEIHIIDKRRLS